MTILLGHEWELRQVLQSSNISRADLLKLALMAEVRHIVVRVLQGPLEAHELERTEFVLTGGLDWLETVP